MFVNPSQFEFNLASLLSGCAGVISCWLVQVVFAPQNKSAIASLDLAASISIPDTTVERKLRAAEDELAFRWLNEEPGSAATVAASLAVAADDNTTEFIPEPLLSESRTGHTTEAQMTARVERIEKLLASIDPPNTVGTLPSTGAAEQAIRDPQGRQNLAENPQRRRSDQAILYDTLLRRCLGDDDFAWRMLHKFPTRCRAELESLSTELHRRSWTSATRRINQLRGMAANIAAENLREALASLENACRQQSATRADQLLDAVQTEFQHVMDFIARAGDEQMTESPLPETEQTLSRWPVSLLPAEDHLTHAYKLPIAVRVS